MKRKGLLFVATLLLSVFSLCLVACSDSNNNTDGDNTPHVHDYKIEKSETMHWLKCDCGDTKDYSEHSGGTPTCVEKAECSVCGETYGELGEHNYGVWTSNNNGTHSKVCSYESSHVITENCSGGTATEEERATCEVCNGKYGSPLNHTHNFNKQEIQEIYLSRSATCEERAVYYYSCSCGAVSTETFEYGEVTSCNYLEGVCEWCSKPEQSSTEGLTFTLINNDLEYEVSGYNGSSTEVYIASTHNSKPVTSIRRSAFYECDSLTSVTIGNSVTSIRRFAFYNCDSLTSIEIPDSVTSIGDYAFAFCYSLTSIEIPDSVTSIGSEAFYHCDSLTSVTIPDSVTSIGDYAFAFCDSLTSIIVDANNLVYKSIDGNLYSKNGKELIQYAIGKTTTSFSIPDSVTSIGDMAFYHCDSLTSVTIPNSVTSIGDGAFKNCTSLQYYVEGSLKYLGNTNNPYLYLAGVTSTYITSATINENCKFIGNEALGLCDSLKSVTIPDSVTSIGGTAFVYCKSLTSIEIPDSVTSIGDGAFSHCTSLTNVTIGNSVTSIGFSAFSSCYSLTSVTIGDGVTSIGASSFATCTSLISIEIPNSVTSIGDSAFVYCKSLTSIEIPDSVTSIGDGAFSHCTSLTNVTIGNSVTSIDYGAFADCSSLTSVTFSDTSTWYITSDSNKWANKTGGIEIDVTDASNNAGYFKSTYTYYYWYKI